MKWFWPGQRLRAHGVLGMNERNFRYVQRLNDRRRYPYVDNKVLTKEVAYRLGLPVPALIGILRYQRDVKSFGKMVGEDKDFVIKPARGSGGNGILVVERTPEGGFMRTSGRPLGLTSIKRHLANVLSGLHSLGGQTDEVLLEEKIEPDARLKPFSFEGVPDVRIIVAFGYPVMAMMRLATRHSGGRANLHQGAVGVGVSLREGRALQAIWKQRPIQKHPDSGITFAELALPSWTEALNMAALSYEGALLPLMGVDIVYVEGRGPVILEWNARPGLSIQLANGQGLKPRLDWAEKVAREPRVPVERVKLARERWP